MPTKKSRSEDPSNVTLGKTPAPQTDKPADNTGRKRHLNGKEDQPVCGSNGGLNINSEPTLRTLPSVAHSFPQLPKKSSKFSDRAPPSELTPKGHQVTVSLIIISHSLW